MAQIPTQVTFLHLDRSDAVESDIRERAAALEQFHPGIVGCRVLVEVPHRHRHAGRQYHVRIDVTVPGRPAIVVSHSPTQHGPLKDAQHEEHRKRAEVDGAHRDVFVAVREAFDIAKRQVQDVAREQRHA